MLDYSAYIIVLLALISLSLAFISYSSKEFLGLFRRYVLILLRGTSLTLLFILLINLKHSKNHKVVEKPKLAILVDNSQSIKDFKQSNTVRQWLDTLKNLKPLSDKYKIKYYSFGKSLSTLSTLNFDDSATDIRNALDQLKNIEGESKTPLPVLMITDGNQTYGEGYRYLDKTTTQVFPICVGDSTKYADLEISQVNVNKYVFVGHKFPVEIFINYNGKKRVESQLSIKQNKKTIYKQRLTFTPQNTSTSLRPFINAERVGVETLQIILKPLKRERNIVNNRRDIGIQIMDNKMKIALISDIEHPDIGELMKALKADSQNEVLKVPPSVKTSKIKDFDAFILYQPNRSFKTVFEKINALNKNYLLISGKKTDWAFLNKVQHIIYKKNFGATEKIKAMPHLSYSEFSFEDIGFSNFSYLTDQLGAIEFKSLPDVILNKKINDVKTDSPLLASVELNKRRTAYLFGEGLWRWRMQTYIDAKSFTSFDNFFSKLLFYLSSDKGKDRIKVDYKSFYYQGYSNKITAQFFDKTYEPEWSVRPTIKIMNKDKSTVVEQSMFFSNKLFQADLSYLKPGVYYFIIKGQKLGREFSGSFKIIPFNQEQQFVSSNYDELSAVARNTGGSVIHSMKDIKAKLLMNKSYTSVSKTYKSYLPFIEFRGLLLLIILLLFTEWFIRKYIGLV